jgi:hypothetical protein
VRIPVAALTLVASVFGGLVTPPAGAEGTWTEVTRPCDVAPEAIVPPTPIWNSRIGEPQDAPTVYFTLTPEFPSPPASDFSATAIWGDGTVSPATVEDPYSGCYVLSTQSHTYGHVGAYPFQYAVHDSGSGLDHATASKTIHVWSETPTLLPGAGPFSVQALAGTAWSGTVAEFKVEGGFTQDVYSATIDWGAGTTGGKVTEGPDETFIVRGDFTYPHAFSGPVSVEVSKRGTLLGRWNAAQAVVTEPARGETSAPPVPLRLLRTVVARVQGGSRRTAELLFRVSQRLTVTPAGRVNAWVEFDGARDRLTPLSARDACYAASITWKSHHGGRAGELVPFKLAIGRNETLDGGARLRVYANAARMRKITRTTLGC